MALEAKIEKYLCDRVKMLGGEVRKVKWIGRRGAPDRLVMLPVAESCGGTQGLEHRGWGVGEVTGCVYCTKCGALRTDCPPQSATIWVEVKAPGEVPEPHQAREHARMRAMGQRVEVIDSMEGVDALLGDFQ